MRVRLRRCLGDGDGCQVCGRRREMTMILQRPPCQQMMQHPACWKKGSAIKMKPRILVFRRSTGVGCRRSIVEYVSRCVACYRWDKLLASNTKSYLAGRCILHTTHTQNSRRSIKHDEPWRPLSYHGRHGASAPPLAPRHTDISQHVIQQGCVIKTRLLIIFNGAY